VRQSALPDPADGFKRYRERACKRFIAKARAGSYYAIHDLNDRAEDFYSDFWAEWLKHPRELNGPMVPYIAEAMMNKLRHLNSRGPSVRPPQLVNTANEMILTTIAADNLDPAEQTTVKEQMWLGSEIMLGLPERERVVCACVIGRDSKRKGAPLAGYRLAAEKLGISETRAKKLSLRANKRIRAAIDQIEAGTWCERWARSIELVAAGEEGEAAFLRHVAHCTKCRLSVVHLRRRRNEIS
jgi:hypothetical protein